MSAYRVAFIVNARSQRMDRKVVVPNGVSANDPGTQLNIREALAFDLDCGERGITLISVAELDGEKPQTWYASAADVSMANAAGVTAALPPRKNPPTKEALLDASLKKADLLGLCESWPIPEDKVDRNQNRDKLAAAMVAYFYPEVTANPAADEAAK